MLDKHSTTELHPQPCWDMFKQPRGHTSKLSQDFENFSWEAGAGAVNKLLTQG
jgi:hypothetical protein